MATPTGRSAVLLDALGTLVELEPPAPALVQELRARLGIEVSVAEAQRAIAAEIAYYRAHLDEGRDGPSLAALRRRCAQVLAENLPGTPAGEDGVEPMVAALLAALRFRAYADAAPTLVDLRSRGVRLVVVSNWDVSLPGILDRLGLAVHLQAVVTSAEVGARKPARSIFERALILAGATAEHALHVGDGVEEDVAGALAAGIAPVLIARGREPGGKRGIPEGVRCISSLKELAELV